MRGLSNGKDEWLWNSLWQIIEFYSYYKTSAKLMCAICGSTRFVRYSDSKKGEIMKCSKLCVDKNPRIWDKRDSGLVKGNQIVWGKIWNSRLEFC